MIDLEFFGEPGAQHDVSPNATLRKGYNSPIGLDKQAALRRVRNRTGIGRDQNSATPGVLVRVR